MSWDWFDASDSDLQVEVSTYKGPSIVWKEVGVAYIQAVPGTDVLPKLRTPLFHLLVNGAVIADFIICSFLKISDGLQTLRGRGRGCA